MYFLGSCPSVRRVSTPITKRFTARLLAALALSLPMATTAVVPAAHADDSSTLTIVGTRDVYDSFLVQNVLKPEFEAAFPQYTLNYVPNGTGAAINYAKTGAASALIVHAASLENQFVAEGYSLESYGRAVFWGDFVLAGMATDPAGITAAGHGHDVVRAFQDIATAGVAGTATFVSRGGTPGTTVQEHAIWALTTGVPLCAISASDGGGMAPTTNSGSACGTVADLPAWYKRTDAGQSANILNASACNHSPRPADSCYVFTDRGTFNYLESTNQVPNLSIVTRDNATDAIGGPDLMVNSFHAYGINPAKFADNPSVTINTTAATAFLEWVTSPAGQAAVAGYLDDSGDAPFLPSAAPAVTTSSLPVSLVKGQQLTVTGSLANVVPGTPKLDFVPVKLVGTPSGGSAKVVATATTTSTGAFTLKYKPSATMSYKVTTDQITKIQNAALDPVFGDLLAPTSTTLGTVKVTLPQGRVTALATAKPRKHVRFGGSIAPAAGSQSPYVAVYIKPAGTTRYRFLTKVVLRNGVRTWSKTVLVRPGCFYVVSRR